EIKSTEENLKESFDSETTVAEVAYDQFLKVAADVGDNGASMIFSQSRDVEDIHAKLYKKALDHLMTETQTTYYVCQVCGYVADGMLPDECPVCSAPQNQFKEFK
ncbi:MAG: rubrerythrin family protein, partial [Syntrophorhabdus sp.]|nr:rubrerythrin family protein [Syntrophorhabdus sp.]NMC95756.1 rubrerythrin family protein [Syntrophorhabdus sp.]